MPLPSVAVAVIVTLPAAISVTRPELLTVAFDGSELDQFTPAFEAFEGCTFAVS